MIGPQGWTLDMPDSKQPLLLDHIPTSAQKEKAYIFMT